MEELKPCPFCGGKCEVLFDNEVIGGHGWYVCCRRCATNSGSLPSKQAAIESWNKRVKE